MLLDYACINLPPIDHSHWVYSLVRLYYLILITTDHLLNVPVAVSFRRYSCIDYQYGGRKPVKLLMPARLLPSALSSFLRCPVNYCSLASVPLYHVVHCPSQPPSLYHTFSLITYPPILSHPLLPTPIPTTGIIKGS